MTAATVIRAWPLAAAAAVGVAVFTVVQLLLVSADAGRLPVEALRVVPDAPAFAWPGVETVRPARTKRHATARLASRTVIATPKAHVRVAAEVRTVAAPKAKLVSAPAQSPSTTEAAAAPRTTASVEPEAPTTTTTTETTKTKPKAAPKPKATHERELAAAAVPKSKPAKEKPDKAAAAAIEEPQGKAKGKEKG
jgi:hypothetical protein